MGDVEGRYGINQIALVTRSTGMLAGVQCVRVSFTDCNLWDGRPHAREEGAAPCALWCDAELRGGRAASAKEIMSAAEHAWPGDHGYRAKTLVLSGGEPALQLDQELLDLALEGKRWRVVVETNGTVPNPNLAHCIVSLSPKLGTPWWLFGDDGTPAHEVVVVLPGAPPMVPGWDADTLLEVEAHAVASGAKLYVQPQDIVMPGEDCQSYLRGELEGNEDDVASKLFRTALDQCCMWARLHPRWRVSVQWDKVVGL